MDKTPLLSAPVTAGFVPPVTVGADAGTSALRPSSLQAERAHAKTVSREHQSRLEQAHSGTQYTETSHLINIADAPPILQIADIKQAAQTLRILYKKKLEAEQKARQHEVVPEINNQEICKQTFVLEGMVAALEKEKNPNAAITYTHIRESLEENSRAADDADGSSGYKRLFSDDPLFNGGTLEDRLGHITATLKAYEEVLNDLDENHPDRQYIQLSYEVFKGSVQDLVREKSAALSDMEAGTPEYSQTQKDLDKAKTVESLVLNKEIRQGLLAKQTVGNLMRGLAVAVPALAISSLVNFGYVKNFLDDTVTKNPDGYNRKDWKDNFGRRTLVEGGGTGGVYAVTSELIPPLSTYVTELAGGLPVQPVDPKRIYPDAPKIISENGIPRELSAEEHASAQQAVENDRTAFKRAQAAYKVGAFTGDIVACVSFTVGAVARGLLNGVLGVDASNPHVRAVSSAVGGGLMAGTLTSLQLRQTFDGVPTHTLGVRRGAEQIADGVRRLNPLESANRRTILAKVTGTMADEAAIAGVDVAIANSSLSNLTGKAGQALITASETMAGMHAFFSNAGAEAEVKAAQAQQVVPSSSNLAGTRTVLHGLTHPNSAHIPHTSQDPHSWGRKAENVYQVTQHAARVVPQLVVDGADFAITLMLKGALAVPKTMVSTLQRLGQHSSYNEPLLR